MNKEKKTMKKKTGEKKKGIENRRKEYYRKNGREGRKSRKKTPAETRMVLINKQESQTSLGVNADKSLGPFVWWGLDPKFQH